MYYQPTTIGRHKLPFRFKAIYGGALLLLLAILATGVGAVLTTGVSQAILAVICFILIISVIGGIWGLVFLFSQMLQKRLAGTSAGVESIPGAPVKESVHQWILFGNLISIGVGGWLIFTHWQGKLGIVLGIVAIALAALSLAISRFGRRWKRLPLWQKLLILPGVITGLLMLVILALSGESSSSSSGGGGDGGGDGGGGSSQRSRLARQPAGQPYKVCPRCGQIAPPAAHFCARCGLPL